MRTSCLRVVLASVLVGLALAPPPLLAQRVATDVNIEMGKQTTRLARSGQFESVAFYEEDLQSGARRVLSPAKAGFVVPARVGGAVTLPDLERRGVLLVELAPGVSPDELAPELRAFNLRPPVGTRKVGIAGGEREGYPIYSAGSVHYLVINEVLIQFKKGTNQQVIDTLLNAFGARILRAPDADNPAYLVQFPNTSGHETIRLSNRIDADSSVDYSQPNFTYIDPERLPGSGLASGEGACSMKCPDAVATPSTGDKFLGNQWHLANKGSNGKTFADVNAFRAWEITRGDPAIVVAVLDDMVQDGHFDMKDKILDSWNALTQDALPANLLLTAQDGHGTAAAGLIAATADNGLGVAGIAPGVSLVRIRTHQPTTNSDIAARGIRHAANDDRVRVLSMSWRLGTAAFLPNGTPVMESAIAYAVSRNRVLVFAAGFTRGMEGIEADYPASRAAQLPIIAVSATDAWDQLHKKKTPTDACGWSSNFGAHTVAAPGVDLHTIDRTGSDGFCATGTDFDYTKFSGTSAAAPLVAGIAALMLSKEPGLTPQQIKTKLHETAEHPAPMNRPNDATGWGLGWGRVDACRALQGGASCARPTRPEAPTDLIVDP